jgi:tetratricopeptide (TPR) repeat protein
VLTLIFGFLAFAAAFALGWAFWPWPPHSNLWAGLFGFIAFLAAAIPLNLRVKRQVDRVFGKVQKILTDGQAALRRQAEQMQRGFSGSPKAMQPLLEKRQAELIREALAVIDEIAPLKRWSLLVERQANTVRAQLHFQLKEYEKCDEYMRKALLFDPYALALKLVRMYARGEKAPLEKALKKATLRFKGEKGLLFYALHSWILVKENRIPEAVELLAKGKDATGNEVLRQNWEHLANGRAKQFSNAGLGELWYALQLEAPKPVRMRQPQPRFR